MPEDGSDRPRPVRRLLIAIARAVALFILVTGIYGALGIALPRWPVLNRSIIALLAGVTIFEMLRPARRRTASQQAASDELPPPIVIDNSVELADARATIDKLRDALETARNRESEIRSEYERESEHVQRAAGRALEEIQRTRAAHDELRGHLESEREKSRGLEKRIASVSEELETAQQQAEKTRALEKRLATTMEELEAFRGERQRISREVEQMRQARETEKTKLADLQREVDLTHATSQKLVQANETLKKQFDDERQRLQVELQRVQSEREKMQSEAHAVASRVDELIAQLDRERKLSQELGATRAKLAEENSALKKSRDASAAELESLQQRIEQIEREHHNARLQLEAEWSAKLQGMVTELAADHETDVAGAMAERDAARAELQSVQQEIASLHQRLDAAVQERESALKQLDDDWSAKLQKIVNGLTSDHENEIGEAIAKREEARAEARSLQLKVGRLEDNVEMLKEQLEAIPPAVDETALREKIDAEWSEKLQKIVNGLTADHENDIGDAIAKREEARAEARALQSKVSKLEHDVEMLKEQLEAVPPAIDETALREKIDAEWSEKLQKIVNGLTADHENDIGEAISKREEARAEVRALQSKISRLESQLEARATAPMPVMVDEKALREKIDAEWSAKLQTIVSHIASDHEADIGKAIEEREAARAEVRNLNIKMTALQQKLEGERQAREALQTRYREIEDKLRNAPTQPMHALPPEQPMPHEEQKARADVLEFAEQAFEALKRATSPGTVPVPVVEEKKPRVLIVHHDPRFRSMWQEFLEKNGFTVQSAADGLEGLRVVKSAKPDAVIADAAMPKMDGRELCQMIKSNPDTADVKVILLSGMYTNDLPQAAAKVEFEPDELLRKPVKPEAMKTALSNLLAARLAS